MNWCAAGVRLTRCAGRHRLTADISVTAFASFRSTMVSRLSASLTPARGMRIPSAGMDGAIYFEPKEVAGADAALLPVTSVAGRRRGRRAGVVASAAFA